MFFRVFLDICLPIFVLVGWGWVLDRRFRLDLKTLVKLNINLVVPAFIFVQVVESRLEGTQALRVVAFTLAVMAGMFLLSGLYARLVRLPPADRRSLQLATMFYNSGNYGLPLMALAYPGLGPVLQVFVLLTQNITTFSIGLLIASSARGGHSGWRAWTPALRQWTLWAVLLAFAVRAFDLPIQQWTWAWQPVRYLSQAMIGIALVTLGIQLSQTDHAALFRRIRPALALRLIGGPLLGLLLVRAFGFEGEAAAILILGAGVPTAVNIALLAHEFEADHPYLAAAVFYATLISMATITATATLLRIFGPGA
jgi:predicted permease